MSIINALKSMVYDMPAQTAAPAGSNPTMPQAVASNLVAGTPASTHNAEMVNAIRTAIFKRQTAFVTLVSAADKLAAIITDPTQRLKAAFATSSEGRTVKQIIDAVDIHIADVDGEEMRFKQMLETTVATEIKSLQNQAQSESAKSETCTSQIAELQKRIAELMAAASSSTVKAGELNNQAISKQAEMAAAAMQFASAASLVKAELSNQKATIQNTLTA